MTTGDNGGIKKFYENAKTIAKVFEKAKKEPSNYFELSGRDPSFPARWKAKGFSHASTTADHVNRHAAGVGASSEGEYTQKAIDFLHAPLGDSGDVFVGANGEVCKYDYKTKLFAVATSGGIIKTFWNLGDSKTPKNADAYWEDQKNTHKR